MIQTKMMRDYDSKCKRIEETDYEYYMWNNYSLLDYTDHKELIIYGEP